MLLLNPSTEFLMSTMTRFRPLISSRFFLTACSSCSGASWVWGNPYWQVYAVGFTSSSCSISSLQFLQVSDRQRTHNPTCLVLIKEAQVSLLNSALMVNLLWGRLHLRAEGLSGTFWSHHFAFSHPLPTYPRHVCVCVCVCVCVERERLCPCIFNSQEKAFKERAWKILSTA